MRLVKSMYSVLYTNTIMFMNHDMMMLTMTKTTSINEEAALALLFCCCVPVHSQVIVVHEEQVLSRGGKQAGPLALVEVSKLAEEAL